MALSQILEPPSSPFPPSLTHSLTASFLHSDSPARPLPATPRSNLKTIFLRTRKAQLQDTHAIHQLINSLSHDGTLLPRSHAEICANINTFTIVETHTHQFLGCAALHVYGQHLAEIRSIVVRPDIKGHGAGGLLVKALMHQAKSRGIQCVSLFTRIPGFFEHFHFRVAGRQAFPDKVFKDCRHCARRHACDETAMAFGQLPTARDLQQVEHFLPPQESGLVQLQL
ncbi:GNAT family N-acetyltransferase [Granulicella sp. S190]|uniref:GNAT family N-acetyltransferase n=1 Tax=Granulicella sp. S190 TaxID=1747226 RepID=UPI00131BCF78|nr:GNAT family N-acetyltransferase [Granulicella sp. S190]